MSIYPDKDKQMNELKEFLKDHPAPRIRAASTIREGFIVLIRPIKTICGPEVHCAIDMIHEVRRIQIANQHTTGR